MSKADKQEAAGAGDTARTGVRAEPRCPSCGVSGIEHFVARDSVEVSKSRDPWFMVVHCDQCGHVYNVIAKHVFARGQTPRFDLPRDG